SVILLATELLAVPTSSSVEGLLSTPTIPHPLDRAIRKKKNLPPILIPHPLDRPPLRRAASTDEGRAKGKKEGSRSPPPSSSPREEGDEDEEEAVPGRTGILRDGMRRKEGETMVNGKRKLRREGSREGGGGRGGNVIGDIGGRVRRLWRKMTNEEPIRRCSHDRTVHFPVDEELVTGFHDAPRSPFLVFLADGTTTPAAPPVAPDPEDIIVDYRKACRLFNTRPLQMVINQIKCFHRVSGVRQESLSLKGERVGLDQMESLEAILKKVQFEAIDFEYTFLDDETAISLGEMIEFYDSAHRLNLSFNKAIMMRGWNAIFKAVRNCSSLNVLNLRYTSLSDKSIPALCRTLRGQPPIALSCIHLENVSLSGKGLLMVVCALKANVTIKELYLGENSLQPSDGAYLYQLISSNSALQMLDLRNNQLQDGGLRHICDGLKSAETREKSTLSALVLWNNRLTGASMDALANSLMVNDRLETLNIGCNRLGVDGVVHLKKALQDTRCNLHRLGLQSTGLDCQAAIELAECLAENMSMVRVDLRDNASIGSAGLLALHSAMKMNKTITLLNIDQSAATTLSTKSSPMSNFMQEVRDSTENHSTKPYQDEFRRLYDEIREACERNKTAALAAMSAHAEEIMEGGDSPMTER
ncbi:hypothetical protein PMAYCL1PPCAC_30191, partial [Pristionchus mayeri]